MSARSHQNEPEIAGQLQEIGRKFALLVNCSLDLPDLRELDEILARHLEGQDPDGALRALLNRTRQ